MTDTSKSPDQEPAANVPEREPGVCLRCGARGPIGDDGFCDKCEKALEQACL